jgi:hypothetical protein
MGPTRTCMCTVFIYYLTTVVQDSTVAEWRPSAAIYAYWKEHICSCRMISANRVSRLLPMLYNLYNATEIFLCFVNTNLNQRRFFCVWHSPLSTLLRTFSSRSTSHVFLLCKFISYYGKNSAISTTNTLVKIVCKIHFHAVVTQKLKMNIILYCWHSITGAIGHMSVYVVFLM